MSLSIEKCLTVLQCVCVRGLVNPLIDQILIYLFNLYLSRTECVRGVEKHAHIPNVFFPPLETQAD